MLNESILTQTLMVATYLKEYDELWDDFSECISNYVDTYAELFAVYAGVTAAGVISPLNLQLHSFKLKSNLSPGIIKAGAKLGAAGLNIAISTELSKTTIGQSISGTIQIVGLSPLCPVITSMVFNKSDKHQNVMDRISMAINIALMASKPIPLFLPVPSMAVASDGSTGVLTFTSII